MKKATPQILDLAKRLIAYEARHKKSRRKADPDMFSVCDKLGRHLATQVGSGGFRALLVRSLALATTEVSWLATVQVKADGTLAGGDGRRVRLDPRALLNGQVVLLAQLLGLLAELIGPSLTVHLVREIWPRFLPGELMPLNGEKNEKN